MDTADPVALIEHLEPDALRRQIAELDRQRRALVILLRAAVARERRGPQGDAQPAAEGGRHA